MVRVGPQRHQKKEKVFKYVFLQDVLPTKLRIKPIAPFVCTSVDSVSHSTPIKQTEVEGR